MAMQTGVVEPIREPGAGGEARIIVELRRCFLGSEGPL